MNQLQTTLTNSIHGSRRAPNGWLTFNAPCCHHRGHRRDTKHRGGVLIDGEGFAYSCFNCGFRTKWQPGTLLSTGTKNLLEWLGVSGDDIRGLIFFALRNLSQISASSETPINLSITPRPLPKSARPIIDWIADGYDDASLLNMIPYILDRGFEMEWHPWHWSPVHANRLIVPFYHDRNVVGWTGRAIDGTTPRYLNFMSDGYVFNLDNQHTDRKYCIVVEGPLDAIAVDGVAFMHNEPNATQCARINALGKEVIVVPDRDKNGAKLITAAIENGWGISMPPWEEDIKDVADQQARNGRIYTIHQIIEHKTSSQTAMQLARTKLRNL